MSQTDHEAILRRFAMLERRLNSIGSSVKGNQDFQADRISDVIEQIDEVRRELKVTNEVISVMQQASKSTHERVDRMAEFLNGLKKGTVNEQ